MANPYDDFTDHPLKRNPEVKETSTIIGMTSMYWSELLNTMGLIFQTVSSIQNPNIARAIWRSPLNDRTLRDILMSVATVALSEEREMLSDMNWLFKQQFEIYHRKRNSALHSPYEVHLSEGGLKVVPNPNEGNVAAEGLPENGLNGELEANLLDIQILHSYAWQIKDALEVHFGGGYVFWPSRPSMPDRTSPNI